MDLLTLLDRPIAFQRCFVTFTGSVNAALMLSQIVYWSLRTNEHEGWFYKTQIEWEEETGLTRREQESARRLLVERELIREKRRGVPAKLYFQLDIDRLRELLKSAPNRQSRLAESAKLDGRKAPDSSGGKRQSITETTRDYTESSAPAKPKRIPKMTDEEFIASLKTEEAYRGIDIERELGKAKVWCQHNRRQLTQKFFINWLNKADKPIHHEQSKTNPSTSRSGNGAIGTANEAVIDAY